MTMGTLNRQSELTYSANATDPEAVVCFDTDMTVDYAGGPVPLPHVITLRERDDVSCWSTGFNQTLRDRAEIPGMRELKDACGIGNRLVERDERMPLVEEQHPDAEEYIVVDDVDLRQLEPEWSYYQPAEYVIEVLHIERERWPTVTSLNPEKYISRIGHYPGQFPPEQLQLDADKPYTARTADGVGESITNKDDPARGLGETDG